MRIRALAALALAVLATACGAVGESGPGAPPQLEAIDEPVPVSAFATVLPSPDDPGWEDQCEPDLTLDDCREMVSQLHAGELEWLPAEGETPRSLARLALAGGGTAVYVEYTSGAGRPCGAVLVQGAGPEAPPETGGFPCNDGFHPDCRMACLFPGRYPTGGRTVLAGTVDATADGIRLLFDDGAPAVFPLTGPLSRLDPSRRVFMVEHETSDFLPAYELLAGDAVVERFDPEAPDRERGGEPMGTPGVEVELDGRTLRVEIGPDAPFAAEALLADNEVVFACFGAGDADDADELPAAQAHGRFPPGERAVTVELEAPVRGRPTACMVAGGLTGDEAGAYRLLVPPEELEELYD